MMIGAANRNQRETKAKDMRSSSKEGALTLQVLIHTNQSNVEKSLNTTGPDGFTSAKEKWYEELEKAPLLGDTHTPFD
jgi:hypothetical protein